MGHVAVGPVVLHDQPRHVVPHQPPVHLLDVVEGMEARPQAPQQRHAVVEGREVDPRRYRALDEVHRQAFVQTTSHSF